MSALKSLFTHHELLPHYDKQYLIHLIITCSMQRTNLYTSSIITLLYAYLYFRYIIFRMCRIYYRLLCFDFHVFKFYTKQQPCGDNPMSAGTRKKLIIVIV